MLRTDALQADGEWFGVVRIAQVEVWRTAEGYDSRGQAEMAVKTSFAVALAAAMRREAPTT